MDEALKYMKKSCELGYGPSCWRAAQLFNSKTLVKNPDTQKANQMLEIGCGNKDAQSCYMVNIRVYVLSDEVGTSTTGMSSVVGYLPYTKLQSINQCLYLGCRAQQISSAELLNTRVRKRNRNIEKRNKRRSDFICL